MGSAIGHSKFLKKESLYLSMRDITRDSGRNVVNNYPEAENSLLNRNPHLKLGNVDRDGHDESRKKQHHAA